MSTSQPLPPTPDSAHPAARTPVAWARWFFPLFLIVVSADLATKSWLFSQPDLLEHFHLGLRGPTPGWPSWIQLAINPGVAWGLGGRFPWAVLALTMLLVPVLGLVWWRWFRQHGRIENLAFACILGGALGNLWDRLLTRLGVDGFHGVRDFVRIDLNLIGIPYVWPNFNVADSAISTGFVLLVILAMRKPASQPGVPESHSPRPDTQMPGRRP